MILRPPRVLCQGYNYRDLNEPPICEETASLSHQAKVRNANIIAWLEGMRYGVPVCRCRMISVQAAAIYISHTRSRHNNSIFQA